MTDANPIVRAAGQILMFGALAAALLALPARAQDPAQTAVVDQVRPAVVRVTGFMRVAYGQDAFERYAESSGYFIDEDGILFTLYADYVAAETRRLCERFEVELSDGRNVPARALAVDPVLNLAILKTTDPGDYPMLELSAPPEITAGETVWAIAGARGEQESPGFSGIIKARDNSTMYAEGCGNQLIDIYIDLPDYAYGGPLVNSAGELLGINLPFPRKAGCEEEGAGEGHAVPMSDVAPIYRVLLANPTFERKWLGFGVTYIDMDLMTEVRRVMQKRCGILIDFVWQDGPAPQADIRQGDILVMLDDQIIMTPTHFRGRLYRAEVGTSMTVKVIRGGTLLTSQIKVERRPPWAAL